MGQKVHPTGIRLGIVKDHNSVWFADKKNYANYLLNDLEVRDFLRAKLADASVGRIEIARPAQTARVTIHTARPGIVIGKKGEDVERLRSQLSKMMGVPVHVNIEEIGLPEVNIENESGFLFKVGDIEAMSRKSIDLLANSKFLNQMKASARNTALKFNIDNVIDSYLEIYKKAINRIN